MSGPLLDLETLKNLYKKGMQYAKKKYCTLFTDPQDDLTNYQIALVDKAQNLQQFIGATRIINPVFDNSFWSPKSVCNGCELQNTGIQFGVTATGWYFISAVVQNWCYNIGIFRVEIAPPDVVDFPDRNEAVRWQIFGGYGEVGGKWYSIQNETIYMKYEQPSYSTFSLSGVGMTKAISFSSLQPMKFEMSLSFTDTKGMKHNIKSTMTPNMGPCSNGPGSCLGCVPGAGSMYYSYTSMNTDLMIGTNNELFTGGIGWIDHQNLKSGQLKSLYSRALQYAVVAITEKKTRGWLWFSIQDEESGIQYMLTYLYPPQKFAAQAVKTNTVLHAKDLALINVYKEGRSYFKPTTTVMDSTQTRVEIVDSVIVNGVSLPSTYKITLPGGKKVILTRASGINAYPIANAPYECPALLLDETGKKRIGVGLIEANFYFDNETFAKRLIVDAGGDPHNKSNVDTVMKGLVPPQTGGQKFLAFVIVLIPLWILLSALVFVFCSKENRKPRLMITIVILLLVYLVWKMISV